jgi:hypothetical protein
MNCQTCNARATKDGLCRDCYSARKAAAIEELEDMIEDVIDSDDYNRIMAAFNAIEAAMINDSEFNPTDLPRLAKSPFTAEQLRAAGEQSDAIRLNPLD